MRGHTVASAIFCMAPRHPELATCSKKRSSPPGLSSALSCRRTDSGFSTEHSTKEHTTASKGSTAVLSANAASMVDSMTVTGIGAAAAASRALGASRVSGSQATTSVTVSG